MHSVYNGNFSFLERLERLKKHFGETFVLVLFQWSNASESNTNCNSRDSTTMDINQYILDHTNQ